MRTLAIVCLTPILSSLVLPAIAQSVSSLIGVQYQSSHEVGQNINTTVFVGLPAGMTENGGFLIGDTAAEQPYAVSIFKQNQRTIWLFEQILSYRKEGNINQKKAQILDAIETGNDVGIAVGCELDGRGDSELFAFITDANEQAQASEWMTQFSQVWRANRQTNKLEALEQEGVRCPNPTWGI